MEKPFRHPSNYILCAGETSNENDSHSHLDQALDRRTVLDQNTVGFTLLGFLPRGLPLRVSTTVWMYIRVYPPHR